MLRVSLLGLLVVVMALAVLTATRAAAAAAKKERTLAEGLGVVVPQGEVVPATELLRRPAEAVLVVLEGFSQEQLVALGASSSQAYADAFEAVEKEARPAETRAAFPDADVRIVAALGDGSDGAADAAMCASRPNVWRFDEDAQLSMFLESPMGAGASARLDVVVFKRDEDRFAAEMALLQRTVSDARERGRVAKDALPAPRVVVAVVGGAPASGAQLKQLQSYLAELAGTKSPRTLVRVVAARSQSKTRRVLERSPESASASASRRRSLAGAAARSPTKKFQGFDYVLMSWTIAGLGLLVLFVFLCIPWAPQLDAELLSTLKAGEGKRD